MSKIVIDARESGTSTGRYIDKLIEYLHKLQPAHKIVVLTGEHRVDFYKQVTPSFEVVATPFKEFSYGEQFGFKKQLEGLQPDLVHFGMAQQPVRYHGRSVTTIHDLTTMRFTNPDKNLLVFKFKQQVYKYVVKQAARKSVAILTPSQFVKDDVVRFTGVNPDRITVTYEAADAITEAAEPIESLQGKQFLMYVGRPTPHKNLERLIDAFQLLKGDNPGLHLVLSGRQDMNYRRIEAKVSKRHLKDIIFTGYTSEGQLRWLYESCAAYVFPSLSEGFGLPGLEAMVHGAPVVSSNATCLPEVYGDAAHYFDPLDVQAMAGAINKVLSDKNLRNELVQTGKLQATQYSWRRMAEQTLAAYEQALRV
ncbi:MAG TPA: glycosyltransferase family 1 protein [Verrucomicrobiae bacterium]|nr:glycosyltransferase family 1 protein [Verrucomicrobiae bacterium]